MIRFNFPSCFIDMTSEIRTTKLTYDLNIIVKRDENVRTACGLGFGGGRGDLADRSANAVGVELCALCCTGTTGINAQREDILRIKMGAVGIGSDRGEIR